MNLSKIRVVGQGVDIEKFTIKTTKRKKDLVTVSRVSSVKRLDHMLYLLDACKRQFGATYHLDIYGPVLLEGDVQYQRKLESLIQKLNLSGQVSFKGAVSQDELPEILNEYRGFLNYCTGAVNRSVVEAMACGLPVLSTNPGVADILSPELRPSLVMSEHDIEQQATLLHNLLSQDDNRLPEIGAALRRIIVQEHSVEGLVDKIVREISS